VGVAPAIEEKRVLEPAEDTEGDVPQVEGRRRTLSTDHTPPPREGMETRTETSHEQQPVRRQPGCEETGRTIRENMDLDGVY